MYSNRISLAVKPYTKLCQLLVHPQDKIKQEKKCNVIYSSCNKTHIGETAREFITLNHIRGTERKNNQERKAEF